MVVLEAWCTTSALGVSSKFAGDDRMDASRPRRYRPLCKIFHATILAILAISHTGRK